jgi:hypothetical protein
VQLAHLSIEEKFMNTYSAYVRANGFIVQTHIQANNVSDAIFLLKGQYGADNLVHLPTQIN